MPNNEQVPGYVLKVMAVDCVGDSYATFLVLIGMSLCRSISELGARRFSAISTAEGDSTNHGRQIRKPRLEPFGSLSSHQHASLTVLSALTSISLGKRRDRREVGYSKRSQCTDSVRDD